MKKLDPADIPAMVGGGFYNRNAAMQAAGIATVLPVWEDACRNADFGGDIIVIADYGASQGRNSMIPMRIAIDAARTKSRRPIQVLHTDLPNNDFSSLFAVLTEDPESYIRYASDVFPMAIGRSYFEQIVPDASLHLIWNTWTLHWMSRLPKAAPDAIAPKFSKNPSVAAEGCVIQNEDWTRFLELRGRELRPGGKLFTCFTGADDDKGSGFEEIMNDLWECIQDLARDGHLSREEVSRITIPVSPRSRSQIVAPFTGDRFGSLKLKRLDMPSIGDPLWTEYQATKDGRRLAETRANSVRAWAAQAIRNSIDPEHDRDAMVDCIFERLTDRLTREPRKLEPCLASVLLQKDG